MSTSDELEVYAKDSLDRFGDDLCEVLLSYLSFEDRFRCECVSKQWQRVIFKPQTELTIDKHFQKYHKKFQSPRYSTIFETIIERILHKCVNLSCIEVKDYNHSLIPIICEIITISFLNPLNAVNIPLDGNHEMIDTRDGYYIYDIITPVVVNEVVSESPYKPYTQLSPWMSNKWSQLYDYKKWDVDHRWRVQLCLQLCHTPHPSRPHLTLRQVFCDTFEILFKRLNGFAFHYTNQDSNDFNIFVDKYSPKGFKSIDVNIDKSCDERSIVTLVTGLSQMRSLIDLKITCFDNALSGNQLKQIGINLVKLKSLSLNIRHISDHNLEMLFQTINTNFSHIKRLEISADFHEFGLLSKSLSLNGCKRLIHLSLDAVSHPVDNNRLIVAIARSHPKLQHLSLKPVKITDKTLISLRLLPQIRSIRLYGNLRVKRTAVNHLMAISRKLVTLEIRKIERSRSLYLTD